MTPQRPGREPAVASGVSPVVSVALSLATWVVAFVFAYGPGALRMSPLAALAVSTAAAVVLWLSWHRSLAALALVSALAACLPIVRSTVQALDLVIVVVAFQAALRSRVPPCLLAAVTFVDLTINDVWQRVALNRSFMEPTVLYPALLTGLAVGAGLLSRRVLAQNAELVALREADRRSAVSEERRRIARDLHDVAAHHLSALIVRNRLAQRLATPRALSEASTFTADTAAAALDSMRQVVHVLATDDRAPHSPQPTLGELDHVVSRMRAAGLEVEPVSAPAVPLRRDVEVALVRIAQEALTNVLRHRGPGGCWLVLDQSGDSVTLTVEDDGPSRPPGHPASAGHGLIGMHERATACGGRLTVDASPRGGWRVSAVLPAVALPGGSS